MAETAHEPGEGRAALGGQHSAGAAEVVPAGDFAAGDLPGRRGPSGSVEQDGLTHSSPGPRRNVDATVRCQN